MHTACSGAAFMSIGGQIRRLRTERGLRQGDLAVRLGVTRQAVSKWENDVAYPDITLLPALARLLGVTVDELLSVCCWAIREEKGKPWTGSSGGRS